MNIGEWGSGDRKMVWTIYAPGWEKAYHDALPADATDEEDMREFNKVELDLTAPEGTPDGTLTVVHASGKGVAEGVEVKDGQFVPDPTSAAAYAAVCRSYGVDEAKIASDEIVIDHVFIERWEWNEDEQVLVLVTGS